MQSEFAVRRKMLRQILQRTKNHYLEESDDPDDDFVTGCRALDWYLGELLKAAEGQTFPGESQSGNHVIPQVEEGAYEPAVGGFSFLRWEYVGQIRETPIFQLDPGDSTIVREWLLEQADQYDWPFGEEHLGGDTPTPPPAATGTDETTAEDPPLGLKHEFQSPPAGLEDS